jgi:hypothetical protein
MKSYFFKYPAQLNGKVPNLEFTAYNNIKYPKQYVGLFPASKGITRVSKIYRTKTQFQMLKKLNNPVLHEVLDRCDRKIDELNNAILDLPEFKNMLTYMGVYMFLILFASLIGLIVHSVVIMKEDALNTQRGKFALSTLASSIIGLLGYLFPVVNELILAVIEPEKYAQCKELGKNQAGADRQCIAQTMQFQSIQISPAGTGGNDVSTDNTNL